MAKRGGFRIEHDSMGDLRVPADALWGAQTQRALDNFRISGRPMPAGFVRALAQVKAAAAAVNAKLGLLDPARADAIVAAARAVADRNIVCDLGVHKLSPERQIRKKRIFSSVEYIPLQYKIREWCSVDNRQILIVNLQRNRLR